MSILYDPSWLYVVISFSHMFENNDYINKGWLFKKNLNVVLIYRIYIAISLGVILNVSKVMTTVLHTK